MCAECRAYSHSITLSIPECARSAAHIYISLHWVFLNVRGVPRILTFYNTKHSWICAAPRTYSQSIAFSIPKYPEYARHPAHTHQFLGLVFSRYARHTAHTHQFLWLLFSQYVRHTAHTHQFLRIVSPKCARHTAHIHLSALFILTMCAAHRTYSVYLHLFSLNPYSDPTFLALTALISSSTYCL